MRLARLKIRNILGIEDLEIDDVGSVTEITGGNGAGKSSVLEAVKAILSGGHDATLLRKGAEEGEAVLVLEDGTEIEKRVTAAGSKLNVRHPQFGRITAPQTWVNGLFDAVALDPAAFLAADGTGRVKLIMEAWPVEITREQLQDAVGECYTLPQVDFARHALHAIAQARSLAYDERTGVNRVAKEKATTASQLAAELPDDTESDEDLARRLSELQQEYGVLEGTLRTGLDEVRTGLDAAKDEARREAAEAIRRIEAERDATIEAAEEKAEAKAAALRAEVGPKLQQAKSTIDALEERRRHAAAHARTRETVERLRAEAEAAQAQATDLTAAIERLDMLREQSASEIPVEGLEIVDGEVHLGGIPFPRLNHAKQIEVAVALAAQRASDLGIVCVDGLESLDPDAWPALIETIEAAGLQAFVTRVTSGPLAVGGAS